jgi:hypothetical protein
LGGGGGCRIQFFNLQISFSPFYLFVLIF